MHSKLFLVAVLTGVTVGLSGCAGMGGGGMEGTVYDTQRRVANLDAPVKKLSETVPALEARLDSTDQELRKLKTIVEENQNRLGQLDRKVTQLYTSLGMTAPTSRPTTEVTPGVTTVEPPPTAPKGMTPPPPVSAPALPPPTAPGVRPDVPAAPQAVSTAPLPAPGASIAPAAVAAPVAPPAPALPPSSGSAESDYDHAQKSFATQDQAGYTAALSEFSAYIQRYPNSERTPDAIFWKARSLQGLERYDDAIKEFEKLRSGYANHNRIPYAMHNEAVCLFKQGNKEKAVAMCEQIIKEQPGSRAAEQAAADLKKVRGETPTKPKGTSAQ